MQCAWAGLYAPTAADTPLRLWLQHHGVDEPLGTGALARDSAWAGRGDGLAPLPATIRELEAGGARSTMDMRTALWSHLDADRALHWLCCAQV